MSERAAGDVGEDLLDDRVAAVLPLGLEIISSKGESVNTAWSRCCPSASTSIILSFRVSQGCDLRRPVGDSVADGTLAA